MRLDILRSEIEKQNPGFYQMVKDRHKKLKKIYLSNRQKKFAPAQPIRTVKVVGKNDPCPCGSGKKNIKNAADKAKKALTYGHRSHN